MGKKFFIVVEPAKSLQPLDNKEPGTVKVFVNFALAAGHTAAGAVQKPFAAPGHRADAAGRCKDAVAARLALFNKETRLIGRPEKSGVQSRINRGGSILLGYKLDADAAS